MLAKSKIKTEIYSRICFVYGTAFRATRRFLHSKNNTFCRYALRTHLTIISSFGRNCNGLRTALIVSVLITVVKLKSTTTSWKKARLGMTTKNPLQYQSKRRLKLCDERRKKFIHENIIVKLFRNVRYIGATIVSYTFRPANTTKKGIITAGLETKRICDERRETEDDTFLIKCSTLSTFNDLCT